MKTTPKANFAKLRYANVWEDAQILVDALQPQGRRILSICSAGDNCLALIAAGAQSVVAADLSSVQLYVLKLRIAALQVLDYPSFLIFMGIDGTEFQRQELWQNQVKPHLSTAELNFWQNHEHWIHQGITNPGRFERYLDLFGSKILPWFQPKSRIEALYHAKTQEERETVWKKWNHLAWKALFRVFFSKTMLSRGRDPEFLRYVREAPGPILAQRLAHCLRHHPLNSNPYLNRILSGSWKNALPVYLQEQYFDKLKQNCSRIEFFHGPIEQACTLGPFDGFNLSDLYEYLNPEQCQIITRTLANHASAGARVALWNMMVPRNPCDYDPRLKRLDPLSAQSLHQDRACFYRDFHVAEIHP